MGTSARLHSANRPVVRRLGVLAASVVLLVPGGAALAGRVVAATEVCPPGAASAATGVCEVTFTDSTTWTIPGGVFSVDVVAVGAGGAGGARTTEYTQPELGGSGGGGGGGQVVQANGKPVMPGETVTVSVGAGGVGNNGEDAYGGGGSSVAASRLDVRASGGGGGRNGEAILKDYWYYTLTAGHGGTSGSGKAGGDNQWNDMGGLFPNYKTVTAGGGGGGASGVGGDGVGYTGGQGGAGVTPSQGLFADQTMAYGGGGGGGTSCDGCYGHGGATAGGGVGGANLRGGQDGADNTGGGGGGDNGKGGSGVVIVRFANPIDLPLVSTGAAASITAGSAAAGGTAGAGPSRAAVTARGVVYSTTTADADPRLGGEGTAMVADATFGEGTFSVRLSGLAASTAYSYRAYATNAYGTSYGSVATFTTPAKLAQAITWDTLPPEGAVAGGSGYQPKASVESGLPVSISVDEASSKVCSINAGTVVYLAAGDCVLHANQAGNGDYLAAPQGQQSFTVATASQAITVTAHAPVTAPDGTSFSVTATATSGLDVAISVDGVCSITRGGAGSATVQMTAGTGTCTVRYNQAGNSTRWSAAPEITESVTAGVVSLTATVTIAAKTYDGTTSATVTGCMLSGVIGTDVVTCDATSAVGVFSAPDAGFQSVTATGLKLTGADAARYTFDGTGTGMGKISPATATCTVKPYSVTFDGAAHAATGSCTGVGGTHLPAADLDLAGTIHTDAGTYSADPWTFSDPVGNYADQDGTVADAIGQASSTTIVSCASGPFAYRGSAQTPCTASVIGAGGLSQPVPLAYSANTNAGTATATAAFAGDANHGGSSDSKTFTIQPAPVTMTAGGYRGAYDGFSHAPAACVVRGSYTGALACADSLASVGPDVGSGVVTPVLVLNGEIATNFAVTSVAGSFDISPKALTAELGLPYKAYDGTTAVPLYFCSLSGVVGTDDVTCDTTAATAAYESKDAGMRRATATGLRLTGTAAGRYTFDGTASGTGQIGQLYLHVSASHDPIAYGDPAPTGFDIAYQGFLEGETAETAMSGAPACSTTYAAGMGPRPYDIQCTRGTLSSVNYRFVASEPLYASYPVKAGTLLVQRKALTAELGLPYKAYDGTTAVPLYFCSLSGVVGTDDVTCDTTAATAAYESKDAGMRRATATGLRLTGTAAGRYTFDGTASGTGQIGQLYLHVSASHDPIAYGDPAPTGFDIAYQGFLEGETAETAMSGAPACSTTYAAGMGPRPYDIQCTRGTLSSVNYRFVASEPLYASYPVKAGTLLVQRKALTATVTVAPKFYDGTTAATVTGCTLAGVVGTDAVTCAWTGAVASYSEAGAGSHDVAATSLALTGTAAGRYTFDGIATGTGEILMGAPACTITPYHVTFDGTMHTATGSCTGVSGEPLAGLVLTGTAHTVAGTYADAWTFADVTGNYAAASGTVTDIVDKAAATVVYSDPAYAVISSGTTVGVTLTASVSPAFCGPASFTVTGSESADPVAPVSAGRYTLSAGMYAIVASPAEPNCTGQDQAVLAVVSAGDTANGGGSYKAATIQQGSPRVNFGFTVQKTTKAIKASTNLSVAYKGQLLWMNNGQWRVRASVSTSSITTATGQWVSGDQAPYGVMASCPTQFTSTLSTGSSPKCGSLTGTGTLESWDATANGGLGAWVPSTQYGPPITFTATLYDGGTVKVCSKKSCTTTGNADWFGIQFDPVPGTVIRESAPMPLMVGSLKVN